jgi:hypothetical protein
MLTVLLFAILLGLTVDAAPPPQRAAATSAQSDAALYRAIDTRLARGEGYYPAAAAEQRAREFPLRPFVTMRMPTRAWLVRLAGPQGSLGLLLLLALLAVAATSLRLRSVVRSTPLWAASSLLVAVSVAPLVNPVIALWSDLWAGLFATLALACRTDRRWGASMALAFAAVSFRELALALPAAMMLAALLEQRRGEALAWARTGLLAMLAVAAHAAAVHAVVLPQDGVSQGWVRAGGWAFDLSLLRSTTLLAALPSPVTAIMAPLALFGWAATANGYARRVALAFAAWLLPFLLIGRPENSYWGLLMAPLWLAGLPLALPVLRDALVNNPWRRGCWRSAARSSRSSRASSASASPGTRRASPNSPDRR